MGFLKGVGVMGGINDAVGSGFSNCEKSSDGEAVAAE